MPGPKRKAESKRNSDDWVAYTAFLTPATRDRLQKGIHAAKIAGVTDPGDQSEALEAALQPYLAKLEKQLLAWAFKQLEGGSSSKGSLSVASPVDEV